MKSLGSHFKEKREEKGYDVEDVAEETNIASRYIRAIEEHDFSQFPADVYAKGFIRSYAKFLDLDAQSLVMEYSLNFEENGSSAPEESSSNRILYWLSVGLVVVVVFALLLLRFAWLPAQTSVREATQAVQQTTPSAREPSEGEKSMAISQEPQNLDLRVVASAKTWVYVIFDGMRKQEFMFQPGDEMTWTAEDTIRLRMGNAGGLQLYFDGEPLPKLGETGEVADRIINLSDGEIRIKSPG